METADITIKFVNPRDGRKPPSIRSDEHDRPYYTLSNAAYDVMKDMAGQYGRIHFYTNNAGFKNATAWDDGSGPKELPKDKPGSNVRAAAANTPQPPPQHTQTFHPPADRPVPFGYVGTPQGRLRTMPSVKEQFIMKVVEATTGPDTRWDVIGLVETINIAKTAWEDVMEAPKAAAATMSVRDSQDNMTPPWEPPPPNSPDDYLAGG